MHPALLVGVLLAFIGIALALLWALFVRHREAVVRRIQVEWLHLRRSAALKWLRHRYPQVWKFTAARFARGEYLGLHLTIGLAISVLGLWLFAGITEDVLNKDPLTQFDVAVLEALHRHATLAGTAFFGIVSRLGDPVTMTVIALAGVVLLVRRRDGVILTGWIAAFAGSVLLDNWLKLLIRRPRPTYAAALLHNATWSFPSGHAMGALVGYGMLAYVLVLFSKGSHGTRFAMVATAALLVIAIGVSRLYLGVHYFSDVMGGYAAGMLWLSACISGVEVARRWRVLRPTS